MPPITFGVQLLPLLPAPDMVDVGVRLESLGFDHVSMPDHMLYPDRNPGFDAWTLMAGIAARTRRVTLGMTVSDVNRCHPAVFAQRVATMDQLTRGRMLVGLGAGEVMNLDPFGIPWNKPVSRLKEAVAIMRHLWDRKEPLNFEGEFYHLRNASLDVHPYRDRTIPIYLAALGPVMQKFAGEHCDGWMPPAIPAPMYSEYFSPIEAAASAAGRSGAVKKTATVVLALTSNEALVRRTARRFTMDVVWAPLLPRLGFKVDVPPDIAAVHYTSVNPCDAESMQRYKEHGRLIPEEVTMNFLLHGNMAALRRGIGDYVDAGVTHFTIINASPDPTGSTLAMAAELLPYFKRKPAPLAARIGNLLAPYLPRSAAELDAVKTILQN